MNRPLSVLEETRDPHVYAVQRAEDFGVALMRDQEFMLKLRSAASAQLDAIYKARAAAWKQADPEQRGPAPEQPNDNHLSLRTGRNLAVAAYHYAVGFEDGLRQIDAEVAREAAGAKEAGGG